MKIALALVAGLLPAAADAETVGQDVSGSTDRVMVIRVDPKGTHQAKADALLKGAARFMLIAEEENVGARATRPDDLIKMDRSGLGTLRRCDKSVLSQKGGLALGMKIGMVPPSMEGDVDIQTNAFAAQREACPYQDVLDLKAKVWVSADGSQLFMSPVSLEISGGRDRRYRL